MIISLGEALVDFVSLKNLSFDGFPGGSPYNTSIAISRLGINCQFLGRISNDIFGNSLIKYLKENNVGTDYAIRSNDNSTLSFVQKKSDGQAQYAFFANETADKNWSASEINSIELPDECKIIHFGSISISQEPSGTILTDFLENNGKNKLLSFDPNIRPSLITERELYLQRFKKICGFSSIIKLSDEDLNWIYPDLDREEAIADIFNSGIALIALTEGEKGAWIMNNKTRVLSPITKMTVADTIGAGDTFHGALLSYLYKNEWFNKEALSTLNENQLKSIGDYSNKAAGINCSRSGADPPTAFEMN